MEKILFHVSEELKERLCRVRKECLINLGVNTLCLIFIWTDLLFFPSSSFWLYLKAMACVLISVSFFASARALYRVSLELQGRRKLLQMPLIGQVFWTLPNQKNAWKVQLNKVPGFFNLAEKLYEPIGKGETANHALFDLICKNHSKLTIISDKKIIHLFQETESILMKHLVKN